MQGHMGTAVSPPDEGLEAGFARAKQVLPPRPPVFLSESRASESRWWTGRWGRQWPAPEGAYILLYI